MKKILSLTLCFSCFSQFSSAEVFDVYFGCVAKEAPGIYHAELDTESGQLSPLTLAAEHKGGGFLALSEDESRLVATTYVKQDGSPYDGGVASYSINDDGQLRIVNSVSAKGKGTCHVSFDATAEMVMAVNYSTGSVVSFKMDGKGALSPAISFFQNEGSSVNKKRQKGPHAHSIYPGPENRFAYALDLGIDKVLIYSMEPAEGKLLQKGEVKIHPGAGPRHMKFGKDGKFAYVLNELDNTITVLLRASDGMLEQKQVISTLPEGAERNGVTCSEIRIHPSGKYVYNANRDTKKTGKDTLSVFTVNKLSGELTLIQNEPAEVIIPRNITLDPSGKFLVVCGQASKEISVFQVDQDNGKLDFTGQKVPAASPMCAVFRKKN